MTLLVYFNRHFYFFLSHWHNFKDKHWRPAVHAIYFCKKAKYILSVKLLWRLLTTRERDFCHYWQHECIHQPPKWRTVYLCTKGFSQVTCSNGSHGERIFPIIQFILKSLYCYFLSFYTCFITQLKHCGMFYPLQNNYFLSKFQVSKT